MKNFIMLSLLLIGTGLNAAGIAATKETPFSKRIKEVEEKEAKAIEKEKGKSDKTVAYFYGKRDGRPVLFSHGLKKDHEQYEKFTGKKVKKDGKDVLEGMLVIDPSKHLIASFDYPRRSDLGQENDMEMLEKALKALEAKIKPKKASDKPKKIIGIGIDRGASALINYLGENSDKEFAALVLFAPFSSFGDIVQHKMNQIYKWKWFAKLPAAIAKNSDKMLRKVKSEYRLKEYDRKGIQAIDYIDDINENTPILFIHSKKDELAPIDGTRNLYNKLIQSRDNVYLLELESGSHSNFVERNASKIQKVVNAFYKEYGLEYDKGLAEKADLENYQPVKAKFGAWEKSLKK